MNFARLSLYLFTCIAFATAAAHFSCIFIGEQCYRIQLAPDFIIQSANSGTWLAPLATTSASIFFIILGCYGLSSAGKIKQLPSLDQVVTFISIACVIRGLLPIQLWLRKPDVVQDNVLIIGIIWLISGGLLFFGHRYNRN